MTKLLLLEDDAGLVDGLAYSLQKNGFLLDIARTVEQAAECLKKEAYDLLLLDVTLPDGTGFSVCEQLRGQGNRVPIIFLTAADEEVNVIRGLDSGGDDYITKPFKLGELCSRIHALLRRSTVSGVAQTAGMQPTTGTQSATPEVNAQTTDSQTLLASGAITIDLLASRVCKGDTVLELTGAEYRLLCLFIRNENITLTRGRILDELWDGAGSFVDDNTLSVYVRRLREKIENDPAHPQHLLTVRGFGYRWKK